MTPKWHETALDQMVSKRRIHQRLSWVASYYTGWKEIVLNTTKANSLMSKYPVYENSIPLFQHHLNSVEVEPLVSYLYNIQVSWTILQIYGTCFYKCSVSDMFITLWIYITSNTTNDNKTFNWSVCACYALPKYKITSYYVLNVPFSPP